MSSPPSDSDPPRPVLGPSGNKSRSSTTPKTNKPEPAALSGPVLRKCASSVWRGVSMSASCSSDASSDSFQSRASTGRINPRNVVRRKRSVENGPLLVQGSVSASVPKKRCGWLTSNADPIYTAFHDEEWGVPVHDDQKLFELLSLCTALAELTWPVILNRRHSFREVFQDFDPVAISILNEKKIASAGSPASSLLSELKLRAIIENARQTCKIINELGSFDKYIWSFVNYKPIVGHFRYPRQVPIKTSKADAISKDLVRRGFRGIGPTVVYSFMQVAGITNDHLIGCFRFHDCIAASDTTDKGGSLLLNKTEGKHTENAADLGIARDIDDLSLC